MNTQTVPGEYKTSRWRTTLVVLVLLVAVVAAWFAFYTLRTQPIVDETLRDQFSWQLAEVNNDESTPGIHTFVSLKIADVSVPVGTYVGTCDNPESFLENELSGIICRNKEGGTEIGIFRESGDLVLKESIIDSVTGRGTSFTPVVKK